ncbi:MAG: hypothetical protein ACRDV8_00895, partial [Acidimicrobiales bacterium]
MLRSIALRRASVAAALSVLAALVIVVTCGIPIGSTPAGAAPRGSTAAPTGAISATSTLAVLSTGTDETLGSIT